MKKNFRTIKEGMLANQRVINVVEKEKHGRRVLRAFFKAYFKDYDALKDGLFKFECRFDSVIGVIDLKKKEIILVTKKNYEYYNGVVNRTLTYRLKNDKWLRVCE